MSNDVHYCNCSHCKITITKKERKKIIDKKYYEKKIKSIKEKTTCPCGGLYLKTPSSKCQHLNTKRHKKYLEDNIKDDIN
jgi:hypothetical protein